MSERTSRVALVIFLMHLLPDSPDVEAFTDSLTSIKTLFCIEFGQDVMKNGYLYSSDRLCRLFLDHWENLPKPTQSLVVLKVTKITFYFHWTLITTSQRKLPGCGFSFSHISPHGWDESWHFSVAFLLVHTVQWSPHSWLGVPKENLRAAHLIWHPFICCPKRHLFICWDEIFAWTILLIYLSWKMIWWMNMR